MKLWARRTFGAAAALAMAAAVAAWWERPRGVSKPTELMRVERRLGRKLGFPTWLPPGMQVGDQPARVGRFRVLSEFVAADHDMILAQEARTAERDRYFRKRFFDGFRTAVGGGTGYLSWDPRGRRWLVWQTARNSYVLSSGRLTDAELARVAASVREDAPGNTGR